MTSICPKCSSPINHDHTAIPSDGMTTKCPSCKAQVQLVRESFAKMAYYQSGKSCATCGNQMGHTLHCSSCNTIYPDFFIAADPAFIRRKARERRRQGMLASFQGIQFSLPDFKSRKVDTQKSRYTPQRVAKQAVAGAARPQSKRLAMLITLLIVIIAIAGGGYTAYARHQSEQAYRESYFKVLYGIKTGAELASKQCTKVASDWKTAQDSGRTYTPNVMPEDIVRLKKVKSGVDKLISQLTPPSNKFEKPNASLLALNNQYSQIHSLAIAPPNNLAAFSGALAKSGEEFGKKSQALKASLDAKMLDQLKNSKQTYKVLRDF